MVEAAVAANPNTVVVIRSGGAVLMPWVDRVPAILQMGLAGQEAGNALASILTGAVNPSGKLTITYPASQNASWITTQSQYPGILNTTTNVLHTNYSEGIFVGYRWMDATNTTPLFPFGHGLSYTTFSYSNLEVMGQVSPSSNATVQVTVCNAGQVGGAEVAQLYLQYPDEAQEPPQLLKGFAKVVLGPGACAPVDFLLTQSDMSVYLGAWQLVPGAYGVRVGSSSRDIRATGTLQVAGAAA
jgi:beta-glucosidase